MVKFYNAEILGAERTQKIQNASKSDLGSWLKYQLPGVEFKKLPTEGEPLTITVAESDYKVVIEVAKPNEPIGDDPGVLPIGNVGQTVETNDMTSPLPAGKAGSTTPPVTK